jgi:predicted nucleic acid-binding protein
MSGAHLALRRAREKASDRLQGTAVRVAPEVLREVVAPYWEQFGLCKRRFQAALATLIGNDQLCIHPFVVAELACGHLADRQQTLREFDKLSELPTIRTADVRYMLETRGMSSRGIGFVDAQLIASCLAMPGTQIWTIDGPLGRVAESLGLRATPS